MSDNRTVRALRWSYKVVRSILFSAIIVVAVLFTLLYCALAIPPVQNLLKERVEMELTDFFGNPVEIEQLTIHPVSEVIIKNAAFKDPDGKVCLRVESLGAGISLRKLIFGGDIVITYVELLNFKADIYQKKQDGPLNIDYIIRAFSPKDRNKPPAKFDLKIHNIVVRGGNVSFNRLWKSAGDSERFDINHIFVTDLCSDITIPVLSDKRTEIDLRRLSLNEKAGLQIKEIGGYFTIADGALGVKNFTLRLPETEIKTSDFTLPFSMFSKDGTTFSPLTISIDGSKVTPSNLASLFPPLQNIDTTFPVHGTLSGNLNGIAVSDFTVGPSNGLQIAIEGDIYNLSEPDNLSVKIRQFAIEYDPSESDLLINFLPSLRENKTVYSAIKNAGKISLALSGNYESTATWPIVFQSALKTSEGDAAISGNIGFEKERVSGNIDIDIHEFSFEGLLPSAKLQAVNGANINVSGTLNTRKLELSDGEVKFGINEIYALHRKISDIRGNAAKEGTRCDLTLTVDDTNLRGSIEGAATIAGENTEWQLKADLEDFDTYSSLLEENPAETYNIRGKIEAFATGFNPDKINGTLSVSDFQITKSDDRKISIANLLLDIQSDGERTEKIELTSDIAGFLMEGEFVPTRMLPMLRQTVSEILPSLFPPVEKNTDCGYGKFELSLVDASPLISFFNLPIFPLSQMQFTGGFDSRGNHVEVSTDIPYIQQGENKLITGTYLNLSLCGKEGTATIAAGTTYPTKKGLLKLDLDILGENEQFGISLDFNRGRDVSFHGNVDLSVEIDKNPLTGLLECRAEWYPSSLYLNDALWSIEEAEMEYTGKLLRIKDFCIKHNQQFVTINGHNTFGGEGVIKVILSDINLDYVFDTLNIKHVSFGGSASGEISARNIFSSNPEVRTERLLIRNFAYNGALLGEGDITAYLSLPEKKVGIGAVISEGRKRVALADGGVWIGRDSLSFKFDADDINIAFMQPFMSAFSSDIQGRASGKAHLFGKFTDIDMTGEIAAKDVDILIDFINARYHGGDTVYLYPGKILIPHFEITDKFGHTAMVEGTLIHRYFHDPEFTFRLLDMEDLLVYDTNSKINPLWYGTLTANGEGEITGRPGIVRIAADVTTGTGSDFTFVLSDRQEAVKSSFLVFTDKRKEEAARLAALNDTLPAFLKRFYRKKDLGDESSTLIEMDFKVDVNDDVKFNLIMDPVAGDKITAFGNGAMNLTYNSQSDDLRIYGKYTLDKGLYNFSLQDIILKEFIIKPGSSISFTGDPYTGVLDITAAYRVNTSLTELDQSFASDRELNRTSVPVEALLKVTGVLTHPDIGFDIELPTVTEETARKVRSIISTDDMMSRQVLYLVALNKFYPPEYMTTTNSGGEWASIASSTISSQLQNMIGQLTDKFTFAPSIRSDKGDFSDIEVDLALSSSLFNNRLLINGNVGYRDPSHSSTAFVGDFDLEYLLTPKGTWRLKAYNHFNDQNYYLKSALTTQGIGIVWRKDFGLPSNSTKAVKKEEIEEIEEKN